MIEIIIDAVVIYFASSALPGIHISNFLTAFVSAVVLSLVNFFVKPIFTIITFPITALTLGIFWFFIDAIMIMLASYFVDGFVVDNIIWALALSFIITVANLIFE